MLTLLGIATIAALLLLVLFRVTSVLVALTLVVPLGWTSPVTAGLLALAIIAALAWARLETRVSDPLIDIHALLAAAWGHSAMAASARGRSSVVRTPQLGDPATPTTPATA